MDIVRIEEETPRQVATRIVREDEIAWWVACEGDCGRSITVGKRHYRPVDYADPNGPHIQVNQTAPSAMRCASCGPTPGSAAHAALESQKH